MNTTELAVRLAKGWLRIYTAGLPRPIALTRRREIESDLWEQAHVEGGHGAGALSILARTLLGAPDDLSWRFAPPSSSRLRVAIVERCDAGGCSVETPEGKHVLAAYSALVLNRIRVRPGELVAVAERDDDAPGDGADARELEVVWRLFRGRITAIDRARVSVRRVDDAGADMGRSAEIPVRRALCGAGRYAVGDRVFFGDEGSGETFLVGHASSEVKALQRNLAASLPVMEAALRLAAGGHDDESGTKRTKAGRA